MGDPVCQLTATRMSNHPGDGCGHAVQQKTNHHSVPTKVLVVVFFSLSLSLSLSISLYLFLSLPISLSISLSLYLSLYLSIHVA